MNSIRGKIFQSKRIQVDFASKVFLTRFLDSNNRSEPGSSLTRMFQSTGCFFLKENCIFFFLVSNISHNSSSTNNKKLIKSDKDEDANTERIFDWLRRNHHSNDGKQKKSKKKVFPTKDIPLTSDFSFIQTDIRLEVYSASYTQSINSIRLPIPQFVKSLNKAPNILNPKAHLKHFSIKNDEQSLVQKELDEKIILLDPNLDEIERNSSLLSSTTAVEQNSM